MLTNKDKSTLKQIIHSDMKKIVNFNIGKESLNENNIKMLKNAFNTHEIIKISFLKSCLEQENKQQAPKAQGAPRHKGNRNKSKTEQEQVNKA